jgi:hypothetical protein
MGAGSAIEVRVPSNHLVGSSNLSGCAKFSLKINDFVALFNRHFSVFKLTVRDFAGLFLMRLSNGIYNLITLQTQIM